MQRKPGLKDVAREAGVHVSTVSRALNPGTAALLSPEIAAKVRAVAERMGYSRNAMAAALRTSRSAAVGFVVPDLTHPAFPDMMSGAEAVLGAAGYVILAMSVQHDFTRAPALLQEMRTRRVEGMIVATAQTDDPFIAAALTESSPMVSINAADEVGGRFSAILTDDESGIGQAMAYLHGLGHITIGHVAGPPPTMTAGIRAAAFVRHGGAPDRIEAATAYDRRGAHGACRTLLDRFPPGHPGGITAILAANDVLALGCLDVLAERGLTCPGDVSLIGFMDLPYMDLIAPPLTTIRMDLRAQGEQAACLLLDRMGWGGGEIPLAETRVLPTSLVVRRSCRAL